MGKRLIETIEKRMKLKTEDPAKTSTRRPRTVRQVPDSYM